jgi:hypothetical protein
MNQEQELEYKAKKYERAMEYLKEQVKVCEDEMRISNNPEFWKMRYLTLLELQARLL